MGAELYVFDNAALKPDRKEYGIQDECLEYKATPIFWAVKVNENERESTISPEEVRELLERTEENTKELRAALKKVFRSRPAQVLLD